MMKKWFSAILLCVAASCASVPRAQNTSNSYIEVDNGGWSDVVIYAMGEGSTVKTRLGTVTSLTVQPIELPTTFKDQDIVLVAHPIAGSVDWVSESIHLSQRVVIKVHIENVISMSYFGVWSLEP